MATSPENPLLSRTFNWELDANGVWRFDFYLRICNRGGIRASYGMKKNKEFSLFFGSGIIEEEIQIETRYHKPTLQLLHFMDGEAAGTRQIRFCYYNLEGRFQRSPLLVSGEDLHRLKEASSDSPQLQKLLGWD